MIKKIKVNNFKSFNDLELNLNKYNLFIGPNASGKSNFIQIFKFLRDIVDYDLYNAISMQGGNEYLRNINIGKKDNFKLKITFDAKSGFITKNNDEKIRTNINEVTYEFEIEFTDDKIGFRIVKDNLILKCNCYELKKPFFTEKAILKMNNPKRTMPELVPRKKISSGSIRIYVNDKKPDIELISNDAKIPIDKKELTKVFIFDYVEEISDTFLILETPIALLPFNLAKSIKSIANYDFDPRLCKRAALITGKSSLEENGENLSIILQNILEDDNKKRKLFNLMNGIMPFIDEESIEIDKFVDRSLIFKLKEKYSDDSLAASFVSDGTISIIALIVGLYFDTSYSNKLTIIEEPERNIHPSLIPGIVDMMKEASANKQIIVTTHNPTMIRYSDIKDIFFISREKKYSKIFKPIEKDEVKIFLKNEIGIDELYISNLLG